MRQYVQLYASDGKAETFPVFSWPGTNVTQDYYCCTNATQTPHVTLAALVRLRKSKSCQNHLELHTWLPNYVLLTVRTEKSLKN